MKRRGTSTAVAALGLALLAGCTSKQAVKFAAILPMTGDAASPEIARSVKNGLEVAFEQLKADPGIKYELSFEIQDSQGDPEKATQLANQLYSDSIALIGGVTTEEALALAEVSKRAEKLAISPTAIGDQLSGVARTFFRLFPTALQQASAMANFAKERLDITDLVILIEDDRAFTHGLVDGLRSVFTQYGGKVVAEIPFSSDTNLGSVVEQALAANPTGIYLATSGPTAVELVKLIRERGYGLTEGKKEWVMTNSAFAHPKLIAKAGPAAEGVYLTAPLFDIESQEPPMPAFLAAYRQKFGEDPDLYAGHGFDALWVYGAALKKSAGTLPADFQKGFRSMGSVNGVTGSIQFNENGDAQKFPRVDIVRDGGLVDFQKWYKQRQEEIQKRIEALRRDAMRMHTGPGASDTSE